MLLQTHNIISVIIIITLVTLRCFEDHCPHHRMTPEEGEYHIDALVLQSPPWSLIFLPI